MQAFNPSTCEAAADQLCEFETILVYTMSLRPVIETKENI